MWYIFDPVIIVHRNFFLPTCDDDECRDVWVVVMMSVVTCDCDDDDECREYDNDDDDECRDCDCDDDYECREWFAFARSGPERAKANHSNYAPIFLLVQLAQVTVLFFNVR